MQEMLMQWAAVWGGAGWPIIRGCSHPTPKVVCSRPVYQVTSPLSADVWWLSTCLWHGCNVVCLRYVQTRNSSDVIRDVDRWPWYHGNRVRLPAWLSFAICVCMRERTCVCVCVCVCVCLWSCSVLSLSHALRILTRSYWVGAFNYRRHRFRTR